MSICPHEKSWKNRTICIYNTSVRYIQNTEKTFLFKQDESNDEVYRDAKSELLKDLKNENRKYFFLFSFLMSTKSFFKVYIYSILQLPHDRLNKKDILEEIK
jgi:hypothetical protein